jgi:hypothetical protein
MANDSTSARRFPAPWVDDEKRVRMTLLAREDQMNPTAVQSSSKMTNEGVALLSDLNFDRHGFQS